MTQPAINVPHRPKLTEGEAANLQLDSYLAQIRNNFCKNCGCGERYIELFEVWVDPIKTRTSKLAVKRPTTQIKPGFDLSYFEMSQTQVPVCSECIANFKPVENKILPAANRDEWARTVQRKHQPEVKPASGRPEPSLESL